MQKQKYLYYLILLIFGVLVIMYSDFFIAKYNNLTVSSKCREYVIKNKSKFTNERAGIVSLEPDYSVRPINACIMQNGDGFYK
jgi:hypothetical protein